MKEFIVCSAIHYNDGRAKISYEISGIETGIVICGLRHKSCIETAEASLSQYDKTIGETRKNQGFLTSKNRYVNRKEAFKIALSNDQIIHKLYDINNPNQELTSEDLYGPAEEN